MLHCNFLEIVPYQCHWHIKIIVVFIATALSCLSGQILVLLYLLLSEQSMLWLFMTFQRLWHNPSNCTDFPGCEKKMHIAILIHALAFWCEMKEQDLIYCKRSGFVNASPSVFACLCHTLSNSLQPQSSPHCTLPSKAGLLMHHLTDCKKTGGVFPCLSNEALCLLQISRSTFSIIRGLDLCGVLLCGGCWKPSILASYSLCQGHLPENQ